MECTNVQRIFFIGEVVEVTGHLGGLQCSVGLGVGGRPLAALYEGNLRRGERQHVAGAAGLWAVFASSAATNSS